MYIPITSGWVFFRAIFLIIKISKRSCIGSLPFHFFWTHLDGDLDVTWIHSIQPRLAPTQSPARGARGCNWGAFVWAPEILQITDGVIFSKWRGFRFVSCLWILWWCPSTARNNDEHDNHKNNDHIANNTNDDDHDNDCNTTAIIAIIIMAIYTTDNLRRMIMILTIQSKQAA